MGSLILPCIVARDIHRGTMAGRDGGRGGGGLITGWWWGAYVAFCVMGGVVSGENGRARNAADPLEHLRDLRSVSEAGIIALSVGVAAAGLAIIYVQTITRAQRARYREGGWYPPGQPWAYGMPYGYGAPTPGYPMPLPGQPPMPGYPMPMPGQPPMPAGSHAFGMPNPAAGYPMPAPAPMPMPMPAQDVPVQDRMPVAAPGAAETQTAETQTAEAQTSEPPKESGDWLNPPS